MIENPLSKADRSAARKAAHELGIAKEHLRLAKAAGLPVDEQEARIQHLEGLINGVLKVYDRDTLSASEDK